MDKTTYNYNFPAYKTNSNTDFFCQKIAKIKEEIAEVEEAYNKANLEQIAIETIDVIVACETLLRMLPNGYTDAAKQMVYAKIARRGRWEEDTTEQKPATEPLHPRPPAFFYSKTTPPSWAK